MSGFPASREGEISVVAATQEADMVEAGQQLQGASSAGGYVTAILSGEELSEAYHLIAVCKCGPVYRIRSRRRF
jgi:hypothetical protein